MNQPAPAQSSDAVFAERIARAIAQPDGMTRALDAAWSHNADAPPIAGDELPKDA